MKHLFQCFVSRLGFSVLLCVFSASSVFAEPVRSGLADYDRKGAESAINRWIENGPLEGTEEASEIVDLLKNFESSFGSFRGGEVVQRSLMGNSVQLFYLVLSYEQKPLFARFIVFKKVNRWVVTEMVFDSKIDTVFHEKLMIPTSGGNPP